MANWNYTTGKPFEKRIYYGKYVKQHVDLKARGKHSGITYDLRDAFLDLEKKGLLKDTKKDGFTKDDALKLYNELDKIHQERQLDRNYKKMDKGRKFDYSEADVRRLAQAAGYKTIDTEYNQYIAQTDHTGVFPKPVSKKINHQSQSQQPTQKTNQNQQGVIGFFKNLFS